MTAKEYLSQAYRLDQMINSNIVEITRLREMASGISSPKLGDKVQASRSTDAPFVRSLEKILELEEVSDKEIDRLIDLKAEIHEAIRAVPDANERVVLCFRYINGMTWGKIAEKMNTSTATVRRWHSTALSHICVP